MYNKSAQMDFTERLTKLLDGSQARQINVRTMHSFDNSFLQEFAKAGFIKFDKILKEYEVDGILQKLHKIHQKELRITKELDSERIETFKEYISLLKSDLTLNNKKIKDIKTSERKLLDKVFLAFNSECQKLNAIPYDDMIYLTAKFFEKNKFTVTKAHSLYSHIIIDEYHDINQVQQNFLRCLVGENTSFMSVWRCRSDNLSMAWFNTVLYTCGIQKGFLKCK